MPIDLEPIVERHIHAFNEARLDTISTLNVGTMLRRKNPYMFVARNMRTPEELAVALVNATLSSSEETKFGQTLEDIAVEICGLAFGGYKSAATGIDLEFRRNDRRYLVSIKSGPNWGNSTQIAKMRQNFSEAIKVVRQGRSGEAVEAVNGCCYGRGSRDYGDYRRLCGAEFWEFVSGEPDLFARLLSELGVAAANGYQAAIESQIDSVAAELRERWSDANGELDWQRILEHNSGSSGP